MALIKGNFSYKLLDVDTVKGIASFYLNSYNIKDSDGDISDNKAFNRTVINDFARQKHLVNHDGNKNVGLPIEYSSDEFGLKVISQINIQKEMGRDLFSDYKLHAEMGRSMEHSFGYNFMQRDTKEKARILEYKMWEYTTMTTWGANEHTPQVDVKENVLTRDDIIDEIYYLSTALKSGDFTDKKFKKLETNLELLKSAFDELAKDFITPNMVTEEAEKINLVLKNQLEKWKLKT